MRGSIPAFSNTEQATDDLAFAEMLNRFLAGVKSEQRRIFVQRYWYLNPVKEIAVDFDISESKVKMMLLRLRGELKRFLEEEGVNL